METPHDYWFPRKRNGRGWTLPRVWPGWMCVLLYFVILIGIMSWLISKSGNASMAARILSIVAIIANSAWFVYVTFKKGEPLR